jgi:hypothetical protein
MLEFLADWREAEMRQFIDSRENAVPALPGLNPLDGPARKELTHAP